MEPQSTELPTNLQALSKLCADSPCYATGGVYLTTGPGGYYRVEVTDTKVLVRVAAPAPESMTGDQCQHALIPAKDWKEGLALIPKRLRRPVQIEIHSNSVTFSVPGTSKNVQQLEGRFPDCDNAFPKKAPAFKIKFDPAGLSALLSVVSALLDEDKHDVEFEFYSPDHLVKLSATNSNGQQITALAMPMN